MREQPGMQGSRVNRPHVCEGAKHKTRNGKKKGWSDVFDKLTYSSGPGDNIYVFG